MLTERILDHVTDAVDRTLRSREPASRRRRKLLRSERGVHEASYETAALQRFVAAQVEAFRKILKKYRVSIWHMRFKATLGR